MHLNISSLQYNSEELSDLIDKSETKFSVIGITESHLNKDIVPPPASPQTSVKKLEMI